MIENTLGKKDYERALISKANVIRDFWINFCIFSFVLTLILLYSQTPQEVETKKFEIWYQIFFVAHGALMIVMQGISYCCPNVLTV